MGRASPLDDEEDLQITVHPGRGPPADHHHSPTRPPRPPPPPTTPIYQPFKKHFPWLVPLFVVTNIVLFAISMYINDCPRNSHNCLAADILGRFAFQNLKENPLLGPSGSTLQLMGALEVKKVVENHEVWRLISCTWLHAGLFHVLANMLSLVFVGIRLEQEFGFDVRQPPKNFRQNFYLGKDLNKLLGLPLEKRKAPLLLNFVPTYTSKLADVPRQRKRKASPPTASIDQVASTSEPADQPSTSAPKKRSRRLVKAAKMKQPSKKVLNLLADLPDDMDDEPAQTTPQPKPKKVKKAQSKAKATEVDDAEDAVPISRLTKKTTSAPAKRPAEVQPTGATQQKKQKSAAGTSSGSRGPKIPWEPKVTIEDRPVYRNESAADVEIGVALSTAVLLDGDMEKNEKMNGYANYARMLQHSVQAIQHAHTFSMMAFETGKRLEETEKELADLQKSQKEDHLRMKELEDQAAEATKAKQIADEKAEATEALRTVAVAQQKEAEEKAAQAQKELQEGLATKEADLKASYDKGMDDVAEDYKLQVKQACNHGFILGYNALAKKLNLPADSPWRKTESLRLPCPLPPSPSQADVESESEAEAEDEDKDKDEALVRKAKSSSKDGQVLDLTGDEDLDAAPKKVDIGNLSSDLLLIGRSVEETLAEIDAEVEADKQAEVSENKEAEVVVDKEADAEVIPPKPSDVPAQSSANAEVV